MFRVCVIVQNLQNQPLKFQTVCKYKNCLFKSLFCSVTQGSLNTSRGSHRAKKVWGYLSFFPSSPVPEWLKMSYLNHFQEQKGIFCLRHLMTCTHSPRLHRLPQHQYTNIPNKVTQGHVSALYTLHCETFWSSASERFNTKKSYKRSPGLDRNPCTGYQCEGF